MATNKRWAKIVDGRPQFAGDVERIDGKWVANPTATQLRSAGFKPYVDEIPSEPAMEGYHWEKNGWDTSGDSIIQLYHQVKDAQPPPRTFSKYKLVAALMQAEVWPQVKAWIEGKPGAYDLYLAAEDISEDEPLLAQGIAAVKELLSWTDEQVEAVLAQAAI